MTTPARGQVLYDASDALVLAEAARVALEGADLVIDSATMQAVASEDLRAVKALQQQVEARRVAIIRPLQLALAAINDLFRPAQDYLAQAEQRLKTALLTFNARQDAALAQERERAHARSREQQAQLRQQELEFRATAVTARDAQVEAEHEAAETLTGDAAHAQEARARAQRWHSVAAAAAAQADGAAQLADIVTVAPALAPAPRPPGLSVRVIYRAVVDDPLALLHAVLDGAAPPECVSVNEKFLNAQARAHKRAGALYPGVRSVAEQSLAARAGATARELRE